ncbi:MAG: synthase subunit epsilon [Candidatus Parcubacteria bacterium]|jgi:F-type H+-transporting ATPase subunit epsilon
MLKLKVVTPDSVLVDEVVSSVTLPTTSGMITVLTKHVPIVSTIKAGEMIIKKGETGIGFAVYKGLVNVRPHRKGITEVVVMLESADKIEGLDMVKIEEALKRAEEMKEEKEEDLDFGRIESTIERELNRFKIARKYRR